MILNGLPWKQTEITQSFLSLHPSNAFQTVLLTVKINCPLNILKYNLTSNANLRPLLVIDKSLSSIHVCCFHSFELGKKPQRKVNNRKKYKKFSF